MIKTLVIGLGGRGQRWAGMVRKHPDFLLAGLADCDAGLLAQQAAALQIPQSHCHTDLTTAWGAYDLAIVVVPHQHHYAVTRDALAAGLHCLVEKPFTLEMDQARELVALAEAGNRVLQVGQNYRFKAPCLFVRDAIREARLGRLGCVEGAFHRFRPPRRAHEAAMPWPLIFTQGIHHLDWLLDVLPAPVADIHSCHRRPSWSDWEHPSMCQILLRCADGVIVSYSGSYESRGERSTYNGCWRFECEQGDLVIDPYRDAVWGVTGDGAKRDLLYETTGDAVPSEQMMLGDLRTAIRDGVEPPTSGRRNLATLQLVFDVIRADTSLPQTPAQAAAPTL